MNISAQSAPRQPGVHEYDFQSVPQAETGRIKLEKAEVVGELSVGTGNGEKV